MGLFDFRPVARIHQRMFTSAYRLHEAELDLVRNLPRILSKQGLCWTPDTALGLDVGAGLGPYSRHMLRWCREVIAVEPNAAQAAYLRRVFDHRVHVAAVAVSDRPGQAFLVDRSAGTRSWRRPLARIAAATEAEAWRQPCTVETVDRLVEQIGCSQEGPLLAKIDVEGHELPVLRGMASLLGRKPALLVIEIESRLSPDYAESFRFLDGMGFDCFVYGRGKLTPASAADAEAMRGRNPGRFGRLAGYRSNFVFSSLDRLQRSSR